MVLYYFHLVDGTDVLLDPEGRDLQDIEGVAKAALADARDILSGEARAGCLKFDQSIVVEDGAGETVHRLPFTDAVTCSWPPGHRGGAR